MPLLSQSDVTSLQTLMGILYDKTAKVERDVRTSDGQGGGAHGWTTVYPAMPCMYSILGLKTIKEEIVAQQDLGKIKKSLLYPPSFSIKGNDHVTVAGITYNVIDAPGDTSYAPFYTILIEPIEEDE